MEPIFLRRSVRTASGLPEFTSEIGDVLMPEGGDAVSNGGRVSVLLSVLGMLEGLPGMLLSGQVILLSLLLANAVEMGGLVVQFGGSLLILIMLLVVHLVPPGTWSTLFSCARGGPICFGSGDGSLEWS
jgi:hypothetical protein